MTTSTKASDIWQQILSAPGEQKLKEEFVNALKETGDSRAEIFRLVDEMEKKPIWFNKDMYDANMDKYKSSLVSWHQEFDGCARRWEAEVIFVQGLPIEITITARNFINHAAEIVTMIPLRHLNLQAIAAAPEFFQVPQLAQIASIDGSKQSWTGEPINALAASVRLADLRWLDLSNSHLTEADVEVLAASPNLRKLQHIDFTRNPCRDPVDAAAGYGCDEYNKIVWESVHLTEFGRELEGRYGRIEWVRALENFMEDHPPKRSIFTNSGGG